ncbi:MAG: gliding motility-associated C-terminal domain-containing protein [Prevotellaceae bacterium]|jgi:hypothetical protein|nr:gliding motility-associated C-terminal domain-containing protein [Prevotellaceae bacterium]
MKNAKKIIFVLMLMIVATTITKSQCLPPPPIIECVSVVPNTANGNVIIRWHENPDNACTITGYEIYKYNYILNQFDLLTLEPASATDYTDIGLTAYSQPKIYRMTTKAGPSGNEHSENHHTMLLKPVMQYGACDMAATVVWSPYKTSYRNFEIRLADKQFNDSVKYQIEGYISPALPFNPASAVPLSPVTYDTIIDFRMIVNQNYLFRVKAFLPNGEVSYSNVREGKIIGGTIPVAPLYINLDSLISYDTHNHLHFEIESSTGMDKFQIERSTNLDSAFSVIHTFTSKTTTTYDDNSCNVNRQYFYRVTAFNSSSVCNDNPATISDTLNSIILNTKYIKPNINVSWNKFTLDFAYDLYRNGSFWSLSPYSTQYTDTNVQTDYEANVYDFCYRIGATDITSSFTSISREYCVSLDKPVTMPNAIDPTSSFTNNGETYRLRNQFAPIIGGREQDYEYHLIIFNRWNIVIFETTKPMDVPLTNEYFWTGASAKGNVLPEDTYLYYVKITFKNSKQVFEQKGTVNLIYQ